MKSPFYCWGVANILMPSSCKMSIGQCWLFTSYGTNLARRYPTTLEGAIKNRCWGYFATRQPKCPVTGVPYGLCNLSNKTPSRSISSSENSPNSSILQCAFAVNIHALEWAAVGSTPAGTRASPFSYRTLMAALDA
eukprot:GHVU01024300.1.p1 GENE.GHVU01024300.1~~GHVU01024300.1.p1  ORF type:complete len:136 (-),score=2.41 GHVU01024300.1:207-614(-)